MPQGDLLRGSIRRKLANLRSALRRRLAGEGTAWVVVALVALVFVTLGFDYFLWLDRLQRGLIMGACLGGVLWIVWRQLIRPLVVPMREDDLALLVERQYGELGDRLISAVEFSRPGSTDPALTSEAMVERMAEQANELAEPLNFVRVVERGNLRRALAVAACAAMLLGGFSVWQSDVMAMWFRRNVTLWSDAEWPQRTVLRVEGGPDFTVVRGKDLGVTISVEAGKVVPEYVVIHAKYPSISGMTEDRVYLEGDDTRTFVKVFRAVAEPFEFYVTGGDDTRDKRRPHRVFVLDPPVLRNVRFVVHAPGYTKEDEPRSYDGSLGTINVSDGSTIHLTAECTKDLTAAHIYLDDEEKGEVSLREVGVKGSAHPRRRGLVARVELEVKRAPPGKTKRVETRELRIALTDADDISEPRAGKYLIQILPDQRPKVSVRKRGVGASVTPQATIPLLVHATDDHGVVALKARVHLMPKKSKAVDEPIKLVDAGAKEVRPRHELELRERFAPRSVIQVSVEAEDSLPDTDTWGGPNRAASGTLDFRIVRPEQLMAELVRRQKELRLEFVQTISLQASARGRVLSAIQSSPGDAVAAEARQDLVVAGGFQSSVGSECAKAALTLQGILDELTYNKLGTTEDRRKLADEIIEPLLDLKEPIQKVVEALASMAKLDDATALRQQGDAVAQMQEKILARLKEIRDRMHKLESRQELAYKLEMIIKLWTNKVIKPARKEGEADKGEVLGPGKKGPETQPSGKKSNE